MKINQNISAVIVNDHLLRNEFKLSESVKKLSSGVKFNSSKDSPSGVAISYKMQAQIDALGRASSNTTDGTSLVQTVDGSIGEMTEVLQRMRELCVQAGNDTNTPEDRAAVQKEIEELKKEINRISTDTEYNGMKLLDGSMDRRTYVTAEGQNGTESIFDQISNIIISDEVQAGTYRVSIDTPPTHTYCLANASGSAYTNGVVGAGQAGTVTINGVKAEIKAGMTPEEVFDTIRDAGKTACVNVFATNAGDVQQNPVPADRLDAQGYREDITYTPGTTNFLFVAERYGSQGDVEVTCSNGALGALLGIGGFTRVPGIDAEVELGNTQPDPNNPTGNIFVPYDEYTGQVSFMTSGDRVVITDKSGFEISFEVYGGMGASSEITIEATDIGTLQLQIGANEDQELAVRVPILNTRSLYIDDVDVTKKGGPDRGMAQLDNAISIVSAARAKMGAYENRLDYAKKGLDETEEDMTNALSNLADVDMAKEMTTYTNATVLTQASISVLAQANDLPQQVLSLLQG